MITVRLGSLGESSILISEHDWHWLMTRLRARASRRDADVDDLERALVAVAPGGWTNDPEQLPVDLTDGRDMRTVLETITGALFGDTPERISEPLLSLYVELDRRLPELSTRHHVHPPGDAESELRDVSHSSLLQAGEIIPGPDGPLLVTRVELREDGWHVLTDRSEDG